MLKGKPGQPIKPVTHQEVSKEPAVTVQSSPAPLPFKVDQAPSILPAPRLERELPSSGPTGDVQPGKQHPAISIEWVGPAAVRINQPVACQLVVRNTSPTPVHNVIVRHRLGQGVICQATEPQAVAEAGELAWNLGTLAPDQLRRIDLSLLTKARGQLNCQATVTFSAIASHQVQIREPQLLVKMRGPEKVIAGENVTLNFAVSNPGDGIAEAVKVKAILPDGLENPRGKIVEFEVGNIAPNEVKMLQLVCLAKGGDAVYLPGWCGPASDD